MAILKLQSERTPIEEVRKKSLMDFAKLQGFSEEKLRRLKDVLARSEDMDEAIKEFRRFQETEESETMNDGNGRYCIAHGEKELIQRLHGSWKLVKPLNHEKYLLQHT